MRKKIIVVLITVLFFSAGFLSVDATELSLTKKFTFYNLNAPFVPIPGDMRWDQLPYIGGFENSRELYIPNVEPICFDDNIASLIEGLDEELILEFLENLTSFGPRVTATEACDNSAEYIYNTFVNIGLETRYHYWDNDYLSGKNVEATINGYDATSDEVYIICGHYDTVEYGPGADDDGSGVAAVMAAAKLMSSYIFKNTIKFVAFSGEEQGLYGSRYYVEEVLNNDVNVAGVLNVDMIGFSETEEDTKYVNVFQDTNNPYEWLTDYTINVSEEYYDIINLEVIPSGYTWGSDHYYFWQEGFSAIFYAERNFNNYYHTAEDIIENMDISYTAKNSKLIVATLAELAEISTLQAPIKPIITNGATNGKIGEECTYNAITTDPQNDQIYYIWDWGDNTDSGWIGPYESSIECEISKTWEKRGNYEVKVKAKDTDGYESEWSDPLSVSMLKYKLTETIQQKFVQLLLKFEEKHLILKQVLNLYLNKNFDDICKKNKN